MRFQKIEFKGSKISGKIKEIAFSGNYY